MFRSSLITRPLSSQEAHRCEVRRSASYTENKLSEISYVTQLDEEFPLTLCPILVDDVSKKLPVAPVQQQLRDLFCYLEEVGIAPRT